MKWYESGVSFDLYKLGHGYFFYIGVRDVKLKTSRARAGCFEVGEKDGHATLKWCQQGAGFLPKANQAALFVVAIHNVHLKKGITF